MFNLKSKSCKPIGFKPINTNGLTNHWKLGDTSKDEFGGKDISLKLNAAATTDRFGNENSATVFNLGYGEFPSGKYFNPSGFTYMIWVKVLSYNNYQRIIDFGNGASLDNVLVAFKGNMDRIVIDIYSKIAVYSTTSKSIELNEWLHITVASSGNNVVLYLDGVEEFSFTAQISDVVTTKNYLGKSNWNGEPNVHAIFDEMKIFNKALTIKEIMVEKDKVDEIVYGQILHILSLYELFTEGLIHYWPFASSTKDIIGDGHMVIGQNGKLVEDRFGTKNSGIKQKLFFKFIYFV